MKTEQPFDFDLLNSAESGLDRREFLKRAGGGIFILFTIGDLEWEFQERQGRLPTDFNAFLKIGEDGRVSCLTGKIEMGQGVVTSLGMMLADELDVSLESVDMVMGDTDICPWDMGTFGSLSTRAFGPSLRAAGSEARMVLKELASERLKVPAVNLVTDNGVVYDPSNKRNNISYAELAKGKKIERHASGKAPVKKPSEFKIMGKSFKRRDSAEKVTGKARFTGDIQPPGMLYGKILRPPAHGAKLVSVDVSEAEKVEGVRVIRDGDFIAILHKYPDVAESALSKVKAVFDSPKSDLNEETIFEHLLKVAVPGQASQSGGNLEQGASDSATVFEETYLNDYVAHAPMEPHTAVVKIDGDKATVWASTQTPFRAKDEVAGELGIKAENVHVITPYVGGGFGGKSANRQVVEAARLAKLSGQPVQVAWTRREEFFYDTFRPAAVVKIKSGITQKGMISLWDYHVYFAGQRGSEHFYDIPNHQTVAHGRGWTGSAGTHPFATGPWRAPSNNTNTFARESQIDIMAAKAGVDPVEFRLKHLKDEKMRRVLMTAAEKFGWKPGKGPSGRGWGVACGIDAGTWVAACAEVEADKKSGKVKVKRVVCAQDMGLVVNPEGATLQMEGCIMMGLGYALTEGLRFRGGEILDVNFDTYQLPRFSWLPIIETHIIDNQESDPQGGGEPAIVVMGAVIANAIYDATGVRMFRLPMTEERIKKAVSSMQ
ncbi:MAG TPA: molybdopterin cofactor-binding domain-containing protein [Bacteroidota bacterium]|nr:molybdopterin cofactor-binding domain-containing protein [Bacteroidota bacterium]